MKFIDLYNFYKITHDESKRITQNIKYSKIKSASFVLNYSFKNILSKNEF